MLVYYEQHATAIGAIQREEYQALATVMENRSDPINEPGVARSLGGSCALI
jgi:hypothetical protein